MQLLKKQGEKYDGILFVNNNRYIYKNPMLANKYNFTTFNFTVKSVNDAENVKVCYSTNFGIAMDSSRENCFRNVSLGCSKLCAFCISIIGSTDVFFSSTFDSLNFSIFNLSFLFS